MSVFHPFKTLRRAIVRHVIKEALKDNLPKIAVQGLNYLDSHEDEFIDFIFNKVKIAVKDFIDKKRNKAKDKILKTTESNN